MRMWRFYLDRRKQKHMKNMDLEGKDKHDRFPLYAITNNKKYAEEFMRMRNMDLFRVMKSKVTKEEWESYIKEYRLARLQPISLVTRSLEEEYDERYPRTVFKNVKIIGTFEEETTIESQIDDGYIESIFENVMMSFTMPNPYIFTEECLNTLRNVGYVSMYKIFVGRGDPTFHIREVDDDYSCSLVGNDQDFAIDEVSLFIYNFGYTFKT